MIKINNTLDFGDRNTATLTELLLLQGGYPAQLLLNGNQSLEYMIRAVAIQCR
jgi:hypothetical protein